MTGLRTTQQGLSAQFHFPPVVDNYS